MFEVQPCKEWSNNVRDFVNNLVRVAQKIYLQVSSTGDHSLFLDIDLSNRDVETLERMCALNNNLHNPYTFKLVLLFFQLVWPGQKLE